MSEYIWSLECENPIVMIPRAEEKGFEDLSWSEIILLAAKTGIPLGLFCSLSGLAFACFVFLMGRI